MTTISVTPAPTAQEIDQAKQAIDAYIESIDRNPDRREGAYPYYRFHEPGQPIRGTVLIFHGFSAKPAQMWRLADYLFQNGFNFYQPSLAGHVFLDPAKNWPQVDLKPEIAIPLKQKVAQDPVLATYFTNLANNPNPDSKPSPREQAALLARLVTIEPRLLDIMASIEVPDDPDFDNYFISSHLNYLYNSLDRIKEVESIPGPIYTVGLSVGGAVALGLAASRPDRVERAVAYAPLLKIYSTERRKYVNMSGPLDIAESGWDPSLKFPIGALTAADRYGSSVVLSQPFIDELKNVPTFLVLTENEDAADIETSQNFFEAIGGTSKGHATYLYPASDLVPHPMADPTEVSQGMSNRYWQSLYQETFRFLTTGEVDLQNMQNLEQVADLPQVPPVA